MAKKRIRYSVADARAAGINPLSAIRSGATMQVPHTTPDLATPQFLAEAVNKAADLVFNRQQAVADEQAEALKKAEHKQAIKALQNSNRLAERNYGFSTPKHVGPGPSHTGKATIVVPRKINSDQTVKPPAPAVRDNSSPKTLVVNKGMPASERYPMMTPKGTPPTRTSRGWNIGTDRMTAEDSELEYGELGGLGTGIRNLGEDFLNNTIKRKGGYCRLAQDALERDREAKSKRKPKKPKKKYVKRGGRYACPYYGPTLAH